MYSNNQEKPLLITKDKEEQDIRYYYKYFKTILSEEKYLMVVVKYLNGKGFIITSFYTDKIEGIKWKKKYIFIMTKKEMS